MELDANTDKGGYIAPRSDCPHCATVIVLPILTAANAHQSSCASCGDGSENWLCLICHKVFCSRYVKGHMTAHKTESGHLVAISLRDLNTWCYGCDTYVTSLEVQAAYKALHFSKFGILPGDNLQMETVNTSSSDRWTVEEKEEPEHTVKTKVKQLAELIKNSKNCVIFTGAGISTSAKIPDFRGPEGVWTLKAKGLSAESIKLESAVPTHCHMSLCALRNRFISSGNSFYIISQNIDGLHRRSGIPADGISELHGNSFKEICWDCNRDYLRTFDTAVESGAGGFGSCKECLNRVPKFCHCTHRKCTCGGTLKDSIIHFGENLPQVDLKKAIVFSSAADLCIVLGSSLTVSPASEMPKKTKNNGGKLCIVNLQTTKYDSLCDLRIFAKSDLVTTLLMEELGITVPEFDITTFFMSS